MIAKSACQAVFAGLATFETLLGERSVLIGVGGKSGYQEVVTHRKEKDENLYLLRMCLVVVKCKNTTRRAKLEAFVKQCLCILWGSTKFVGAF